MISKVVAGSESAIGRRKFTVGAFFAATLCWSIDAGAHRFLYPELPVEGGPSQFHVLAMWTSIIAMMTAIGRVADHLANQVRDARRQASGILAITIRHVERDLNNLSDLVALANDASKRNCDLDRESRDKLEQMIRENRDQIEKLVSSTKSATSF